VSMLLRYRAAMNSMSITYEKVRSQNQAIYARWLYKGRISRSCRVYKGILRRVLDSPEGRRSVHTSADVWIFAGLYSLLCHSLTHLALGFVSHGTHFHAGVRTDTNWCQKRRPALAPTGVKRDALYGPVCVHSQVPGLVSPDYPRRRS
jgi:hypothetical protein